jgi:hypothetical protein
VRRRQPVDPERPPERLWSFHYPDWQDEVSEAERDAYAHPTYAAFRLYQATKRQWAAEHGLTLAEMRKLIPAPVVVDRPARTRRGDGNDAA